MKETEILVEQQPPQGVLVCDHAGLVINKFSLTVRGVQERAGFVKEAARRRRASEAPEFPLKLNFLSTVHSPPTLPLLRIFIKLPIATQLSSQGQGQFWMVL